MVERDKIGGNCINVACIPTKALVESARALGDDPCDPRAGPGPVAVDDHPRISALTASKLPNNVTVIDVRGGRWPG